MTNTTKTLEAVKKEAVGRLWEVVPFSEESKSLEYLVMDIAEASYFAALDACREQLGDLLEKDQTEGEGDNIEAFAKALSAIDSLRTGGGKE